MSREQAALGLRTARPQPTHPEARPESQHGERQRGEHHDGVRVSEPAEERVVTGRVQLLDLEDGIAG